MKRTMLTATIAVMVTMWMGLFTGCTNSEQPTDTSGDTTAVDPDPSGAHINAPPAELGFQVAIGPYDVPVGIESQRNYYRKLPNDKEIYVTKIQMRFNKGSYHVSLFKSDVVDVADHFEETFDPINEMEWDMLVTTQDSVFTWTFSPGTYYHLKPHQQMLFQAHYVNDADQPTPSGHGKILVNFWTTDTPHVTSSLGTLFMNMEDVTVPPHTSVTYMRLLPTIPVDVNALVTTGHFHKHGTHLAMGRWDGEKLTDTLYQNSTWYRPPVYVYQCGFGITPNDTLALVATFENPTDTPVSYGYRSDQEHAYYYVTFMPAPPDRMTIYDSGPGLLIDSHPM